MRLTVQHLLWLALGYGTAVSQACGGGHGDHAHNGRQVRRWTQEEIDELERKWGTDVGWACLLWRALSWRFLDTRGSDVAH